MLGSYCRQFLNYAVTVLHRKARYRTIEPYPSLHPRGLPVEEVEAAEEVAVEVEVGGLGPEYPVTDIRLPSLSLVYDIFHKSLHI